MAGQCFCAGPGDRLQQREVEIGHADIHCLAARVRLQRYIEGTAVGSPISTHFGNRKRTHIDRLIRAGTVERLSTVYLRDRTAQIQSVVIPDYLIGTGGQVGIKPKIHWYTFNKGCTLKTIKQCYKKLKIYVSRKISIFVDQKALII